MFSVIKQNVLSFFFMYYKHAAIAGILVFGAYWLIYILFWRRCNKQTYTAEGMLYRSVLFSIFAVYVYFVIGITLLSREEGYSRMMNLQLFSTFGHDFFSMMFIYENILLFIPYGIFLFLLWNPCRRWWIAVPLGAVSSLAIETAQLLLHLGRFEADDILTNTVGMFLGWFITWLICKVRLTRYQ